MQTTLLSSLAVKMDVLWAVVSFRGGLKGLLFFFWKDDLKMIKLWWENSSEVYCIRFLRRPERLRFRNK